jgi:hypothetical protein
MKNGEELALNYIPLGETLLLQLVHLSDPGLLGCCWWLWFWGPEAFLPLPICVVL